MSAIRASARIRNDHISKAKGFILNIEDRGDELSSYRLTAEPTESGYVCSVSFTVWSGGVVQIRSAAWKAEDQFSGDAFTIEDARAIYRAYLKAGFKPA